MSSSFKKILIILVAVSLLVVIGLALAVKEIKNEGSVKNMGEAIIKAPIILVIEGIKKISNVFCVVTGGKVVSNCGISCGSICDRANKNAGKACASSKECDGKCIANLPVPARDKITGEISDLEPTVLINCRKITLTKDELGINPVLRSYVCPSTVQIQSTCQKYDYSGNELYWSYENGTVNLNREYMGM
ncbi:MAG: hypothetical protein NTW66_01300 [Candidatus Magasanikbacteria bacterium]|nr:hypothetical protein [Candidatus Magasanikbacteria bacterium]